MVDAGAATSGLSGAIDPLAVFIAVATCILALAAFALKPNRATADARTGDHALSGLFKRRNFEDNIRETVNRAVQPINGEAVLRGRIDHADSWQSVLGEDTKNVALDHIAKVMRAGVRRNDPMSRIEGDGFVILVPGIDEQTATGIADRLRNALTRHKVDGVPSDFRMTASFGVAARRVGESNAMLRKRADDALDCAGEDHVVAASDIEEILMLPAPGPSPRTATV